MTWFPVHGVTEKKKLTKEWVTFDILIFSRGCEAFGFLSFSQFAESNKDNINYRRLSCKPRSHVNIDIERSLLLPNTFKAGEGTPEGRTYFGWVFGSDTNISFPLQAISLSAHPTHLRSGCYANFWG